MLRHYRNSGGLKYLKLCVDCGALREAGVDIATERSPLFFCVPCAKALRGKIKNAIDHRRDAVSKTLIMRNRRQRCLIVAAEAAKIAHDAHVQHGPYCKGYACSCKRSLLDLLTEAGRLVGKPVMFNKGDLNAMLALMAVRHNWPDAALFGTYKFRTANLMDVTAGLVSICEREDRDAFGGAV